MPVVSRMRFPPLKDRPVLDHATHSKISSLTLSTRQCFPNLVRRISTIIDKGSRSANGLLLECDRHGGRRRRLAAKIEAVSEERSVPEMHSQYTITKKKGCGCSLMAQWHSETWCELLTNGTQFDAEVAGIRAATDAR